MYAQMEDEARLHPLPEMTDEEKEEGKIHLLLEYTGNRRGISDPWYSGDFDTAYREIEEGCIALFKYLTSESGHLQS
jgi:protein-tyrosine-phosphatase, low molecular weight